VFFAPLTHYLRGVIFHQGWSSRGFQVWAYTRQLYAGDDDLDAGVAQKHVIRFPHEWKEIRESTSQQLCEHIEKICLPAVEPMTNPSEHQRDPGYVSLYLNKDPLLAPMYRFKVAVGACFDGDFDQAESLLADFPTLAGPDDGLPDKFHVYVFRRGRYLLKLLREDRSAIPGLLHEWEAFSVKSMGLEKYWSPTPFPCDG